MPEQPALQRIAAIEFDCTEVAGAAAENCVETLSILGDKWPE
jgi:hypothetical protein